MLKQTVGESRRSKIDLFSSYLSIVNWKGKPFKLRHSIVVGPLAERISEMIKDALSADRPFTFFTMNPLFFWNRAKAAKLGFDSVTESISRHYKQIQSILAAYGIQMTREKIDQDVSRIQQSNQDDNVIMEVLEQADQPRKRKLKVVQGGRR